MDKPRTLYAKIWDDHVVHDRDDGTSLVWIDRHLIHEVTTPQAFDGLRLAGRRVHRPDLTLAVPDHNVPTSHRFEPIADPQSATQVATLAANCAAFGIEHIAINAPEQGIVHIIGPEQGFTLPGLTLVCGDSHTATHGAFGALAFGIGTSEVEHVFATQTLLLKRSASMAVNVTGSLGFGVTAKDVALAIVGVLGTGGGTGYVIEYTGPVIEALSLGRPDDRLQYGRSRRVRAPGWSRPTRRRSSTCAAGRVHRRARTGMRRWRIGGRCPPTPARFMTGLSKLTARRSHRW